MMEQRMGEGAGRGPVLCCTGRFVIGEEKRAGDEPRFVTAVGDYALLAGIDDVGMVVLGADEVVDTGLGVLRKMSPVGGSHCPSVDAEARGLDNGFFDDGPADGAADAVAADDEVALVH